MEGTLDVPCRGFIKYFYNTWGGGEVQEGGQILACTCNRVTVIRNRYCVCFVVFSYLFFRWEWGSNEHVTISARVGTITYGEITD